MGSRYAVNEFMQGALAHGLDYERIPFTSKLHFANSETTSAHQALEFWFPTKPPMFIVVDIVEQGRAPIPLLIAADEAVAQEIGHATRLCSDSLRGPWPLSCTGDKHRHHTLSLIWLHGSAYLRVHRTIMMLIVSSFFAGDRELTFGTCLACVGPASAPHLRWMMQEGGTSCCPRCHSAS